MASDDEDTTLFRRVPVAAAAEPVLHVVVATDETGETRRLPLAAQGLRIGRVAGNDLVLPSPDVSRQHAVVTLAGEEVLLTDLGSTNGTWLEGRRITGSAKLAPGAHFSIGPFALNYQRGPQREMARAAEMEAELDRAFQYIRALLPAPITEGRVRADWRYRPSAGIGGDALGYRWLDPARFAVFMIDVAGHGLGSALLAASVMNALRDRAEHDPAVVLAQLNASFQMEEQSGLFFTVWYGVADLDARRLDFAAAGHHPGYLAHPDVAQLAPVTTRNPAIGMMPAVRFAAGQVRLPPGTRLVLFSDGAFETVDPAGRQRGLDDFLRFLAGPELHAPDLPERLMQRIRATSRPGPLEDDATILCVDFP
jgi:hypothetical protein